MMSISISRSRLLDVFAEVVQFSVHAAGVGVGSAFPGNGTSPPCTARGDRAKAKRERAISLRMIGLRRVK